MGWDDGLSYDVQPADKPQSNVPRCFKEGICVTFNLEILVYHMRYVSKIAYNIVNRPGVIYIALNKPSNTIIFSNMIYLGVHNHEILTLDIHQ